MATRPKFDPLPERADGGAVAGGHGDVQTVPVTDDEVRVTCACGWTSNAVLVGTSHDVWIEHVMEHQFTRDPAAWNDAVPAEEVLERLRSGSEAEH